MRVNVGFIMGKETNITGSSRWTGPEFRQSFELIKSGKIKRKSLITLTFPLAQAREAYETQLNTGEAIKVIISP